MESTGKRRVQSFPDGEIVRINVWLCYQFVDILFIRFSNGVLVAKLSIPFCELQNILLIFISIIQK